MGFAEDNPFTQNSHATSVTSYRHQRHNSDVSDVSSLATFFDTESVIVDPKDLYKSDRDNNGAGYSRMAEQHETFVKKEDPESLSGSHFANTGGDINVDLALYGGEQKAGSRPFSSSFDLSNGVSPPSSKCQLSVDTSAAIPRSPSFPFFLINSAKLTARETNPDSPLKFAALQDALIPSLYQ